jgi:hypothetical protein
MQVSTSLDVQRGAPAGSGASPPQPRLSATQAGDVSAGRARVVEGQVYQIDRAGQPSGAPAVDQWADQPAGSPYRQSFDQVANRLGTRDRATVNGEISRQLYGEAGTPASARPAPAHDGGSREGVGSFLDGAVLGNFSDNDSWSATAGQVVTGFIPIVGQIADARDTIASIGQVIEGKPGGWLNLGASVVGWVPGIGDAAKAAIRGTDKAVEAGAKVAEGVARHEAPKVTEKAVEGTARREGEASGKLTLRSEDGAKAAEEATRKQITVEGGKKGDWPKELNAQKLEPNADYHVNGYSYATDAQGRVVEAKGDLELKTSDRNSYQQEIAGRGDRLPTDQGGHLIATIFHGPGDRINLVPMNGNLNVGAWKRMENSFADALKAGKSVDVDIKVVYSGGSQRPTHFVVDSVIDGEPKTFTFRDQAGG